MIATVTLWTATRYCKRYLLLRHVTIFNKLGIYLLGVTSHKAISEGKMRKTLQKRHSWTDEELKILSYLRRTCHWHFKQIQKSYFPSLSLSALRGAYWHQSTEDRIRRASNATIPIIDPRNSVKGFSSASKTHSISDNLSRSENSIEALASTPQSPVDRNRLFISNECNSSRYELRPNRPSNFPPRKPQYLVDRRRFPHFFRSYKYSLNRQGIPDSDYTPPSRMPTPSSSDRSVSIVSSLPSAASSLELFGLELRGASSADMTEIAKFEQFGINTFYNGIPTLDNASDWFRWNQKVNEFIRISAVADDGATPLTEEEAARQWIHRQKFYSAMITAKLTHNAAQRINAFEIPRVQALLKAVQDNFKPEGSGTYVSLQRRYMALTRDKCGSTQALGAEIRKIHAEKLLLDPDCVTSEIERTFFFVHALGPEYESFRDHIFRQMDLVNERDANGSIIKAAPTFDYIENKAIEEEHRKGQLGKQAMESQALPALALVRGPGDKKLIPSSDGTTCRIEIDNVPYCSFCRKPYHIDAECFTKNPRLKVQRKDGDGPKPRPGRIHIGGRRQSKRRTLTDDEDDDGSGPKDPKKPTFMATKVSGKDVNEAFGNDIEGNLTLFDHVPIMMAIKTPSIRDAWIVDSGCAQHVCNSASRFVQMAKYHGPSLRGIDTSTAPSGVGTVNILCNVRGRKKWLVLDNVLYVPSAHANLISVLQLLQRGAKVEFSSRDAILRNKSNGKNLFTASEYHGVYALDLWASLTFPSYHVSSQMSLWHSRLAHMSDANLRRLKQQAHGVRDMEARHPCNPCLQGRMIERSHRRSRVSRRGEHTMDLLHIDVAGPFDEGLDGSRYWLTIVDDFTGWIEIFPIPRRQHFVIESLRFFLDHNERPERKCKRIRLDRISEHMGDEMKFMLFSRAIQAEVTGVDQHQQNGVAERAHKTIYDRLGPTLAHARLPSKFWREIARTAAFLSNRSPSSKLNMTPYQAWYGDRPDLSRLRIIGSKGEYLIPPKQRKKLTDPRTRPCILLGYEGTTNYRILLGDGRIVGTPNAEFQEVLTTPSTQTLQDVGARQDGSPEATAAVAGGVGRWD
ncbi:hypothetical protein N7541_007937 [Penicillium brevicompactum]|uniref:Integrase catalytic domain-containing protein n=1 Tax=Penicillium brevicompactum TaxID=5074 RepID=A0A9W9QYB7_PENBR|nr:hypothetical protein N7541_007937 [Penicillium brevicompactum]